MENSTELKVASVSAINNTTFELTVALANAEKEDAPAALTLKHGESGKEVTATFVKFEDGVATYKVDKADLTNGAYSITATGLDFSGFTTAYSAVITGNYVEGFVYDDATKPVEGATVKVGNETTTTNEYGYYKIATNPGLKTVEISKGTKYFVEEVPNIRVQRNYSTVSNVDLTTVDPKTLLIEGTVLNDKDSSPILGADVQLQAKNADGTWVDVDGYTTKTIAGGKYTFGNTASSATIKTTDVLEIGKEYRVVAESNISDNNLDKVFHKEEQVFTTSNKKAKTELLTKLTEVKELKSLKLDLTWASDIDGTANAKIEFVDQDGKTVLEEITAAAFSKTNATDRKLSEAYDLVKAPGFTNATTTGIPQTPQADASNKVNPRLVSGTYFLRINDGTNAITIVPVEITEGQDASVSAEIKKSQSVQMNANVLNVKYQEALLTNPSTPPTAIADYLGSSSEPLTQIKSDNTRDTNTVDVTYNVYQEVAGKKVFVTNEAAEKVMAEQKVGATTPADIKLAPAAVGLDKLAAGTTYTFEATSDYVTGNKEITKKVEDNAIQGETLSVSAAAKLAEVKLGGNAATATSVEVNNIKLINKAGAVVKETGAFKSGTIGAGNNILTGNMEDVFAGVPAGEYKIEIDVKGYEVETTTLKKILDFQNAEITANLKAIKDPIVTGYVRFADNGENVDDASNSVADATVIAYDEKGEAVVGVDLANTAATYTINTGLEDGKTYTFVVRGNGFETQAVTRTVQNGENLALNFDVVRGGKGMFKYTIVDSNNNNLLGLITTANNTDFVITDSYYDKSATPVTLAGLTFEGKGSLTSTDGKTFTSAEALSKDSYKLSIAASTNTNKYSTSLTINEINGTEYGTIKVPAKTSDLTAEIEVTITGAVVDATSTDIDYVVLVDENGTPVGDPVRASLHNGTPGTTNVVKFQAPVNAKYEVQAFLKDGFVAKAPVTVQDFDQKVSIVVDKAGR